VNNSAVAGDVLANKASSTTGGLGTSGAGVLGQNAGARATFGDVGAFASVGIKGDYLDGVYPRVMSWAIFQDTLTFASLSGTPAYLEIEVGIDGSGAATNFSYWRSSSVIALNNSATIQFIADCGQALQTSDPCGADLSLSHQYGGGPTTNEFVPDFSLTRTLLIPWAWVAPSYNQIVLYSDFNVDAQIGQKFPMIDAVASAHYFTSSKIGGFRVLDANLVDLGVQFSSESGHDYTQPLTTSPVPEPSSWIGMASGAACVLLLKLRSKEAK
jgi:hypothetical protein